jgi:hypothetical protein
LRARFLVLLSVGLCLGAMGCGGDSASDILGSCQLPSSTPTPADASSCVEYHGAASAHGAAEEDCIDPAGKNGTWMEGLGCDHRNASAGCVIQSGDYATILWFFQCADYARNACDRVMGQYITP